MPSARIIQRYIFGEMVGPFFVALGAFTFVLLIAKIMELTDLVVTRGVGLDVVGRLLLYTLPYFFVFTIPVATLLSVLLAFLRLSGDNEITALKAAGVGLMQLLPPVALLSFLAWLAASLLAIWGLPWGNHNFENLLFQTARAKTSLALHERVFMDTFSGLVIYINRLPGEGQMQDVFIVDERDPTRVYTVVAKRGKVYPVSQGKVTVRLFDGTLHTVGNGLKSAQTAQFETYDVTMDSSALGTVKRTGQKHEKEMTVAELLSEMHKEPPGTKRYNLLDMELQKKFTLPFSCLVMALIGLPLGIQSRSGRSWGVAVALVIFFSYYVMLSAAWSFGAQGVYPPRIGMWVPNAIFSILGLLLFRRELKATPIPLLDKLDRIPALITRLCGGSSAKKG
ncbi:lipopolysaccharide export system permease protein [Desulfarculales bacterium]